MRASPFAAFCMVLLDLATLHDCAPSAHLASRVCILLSFLTMNLNHLPQSADSVASRDTPRRAGLVPHLKALLKDVTKVAHQQADLIYALEEMGPLRPKSNISSTRKHTTNGAAARVMTLLLENNKIKPGVQVLYFVQTLSLQNRLRVTTQLPPTKRTDLWNKFAMRWPDGRVYLVSKLQAFAILSGHQQSSKARSLQVKTIRALSSSSRTIRTAMI
jgi:hypothetical protein